LFVCRLRVILPCLLKWSLFQWCYDCGKKSMIMTTRSSMPM